MDTYLNNDDELLEMCSHADTSSMHSDSPQRGHRHAPSASPPFMDVDVEVVRPRAVRRRGGSGDAASVVSGYSACDASSIVSGFFFNEGPRTRTSSTAYFSQPHPPKQQPYAVAAVRQQRREANTPGPGEYTPVYAVLGKKSPFA